MVKTEKADKEFIMKVVARLNKLEESLIAKGRVSRNSSRSGSSQRSRSRGSGSLSSLQEDENEDDEDNDVRTARRRQKEKILKGGSGMEPIKEEKEKGLDKIEEEKEASVKSKAELSAKEVKKDPLLNSMHGSAMNVHVNNEFKEQVDQKFEDF